MSKEFWCDLRFGEEGEIIVVKELSKLDYKLISTCKTYEYDVLLEKDGNGYTFEVKTDIYCSIKNENKTVYIEFEHKNNPSGICVSKADYYVLYMRKLNEIWIIETPKLKHICLVNNLDIKENNGDDHTRGFILDLNKYKDSFSSIITGLNYYDDEQTDVKDIWKRIQEKKIKNN